MLEAIFSFDFLYALLRAATPILFAALASTVSEKAGITNMALEGMLLFSALFGVIFTGMSGSFITGLFCTVLAGGVIGFLMAVLILNLRTDEILAAIAINLIATGGTVLLLFAVSGDRGSSASIASIAAPKLEIFLLRDIPVVGEILSGQNALTYLAIFMVFAIHMLLYKTPLGLNIRAVGENKHAAESVGIPVRRVQYTALILSGMLTSFGGFFLSGGYMNMFTRDMSAGRGFIGLAASVMGGNTPLGSFAISLLFGTASAAANVLQITTFPMELIQMIPYITTIAGLGFYSYSQKKRLQKNSK